LQNGPDPYHVETVASNTTTFQLVAFGICLAFEILESPSGSGELAATGRAILAEFRPKTLKSGPLKLGSGKQPPADLADRFLTEIRSDFPSIAISNRVGGDAYTIRKRWYTESDKPADDPVPIYRPKDAGVLFIDKGVSYLPPHVTSPDERS
jgi:hypothetical protein